MEGVHAGMSSQSHRGQFYSWNICAEQLFGWDFDSLWRTVNQRRCDALFRADRVNEAVKSFEYMMSMIDDNMKSSCLKWSSSECVIVLNNLNSETHFDIDKSSEKTAPHNVSQREKKLLPRPTMRWLLNFIRLQSGWIPQTSPFLHAAVRPIRR
jgi:hypothetical protein